MQCCQKQCFELSSRTTRDGTVPTKLIPSGAPHLHLAGCCCFKLQGYQQQLPCLEAQQCNIVCTRSAISTQQIYFWKSPHQSWFKGRLSEPADSKLVGVPAVVGEMARCCTLCGCPIRCDQCAASQHDHTGYIRPWALDAAQKSATAVSIRDS